MILSVQTTLRVSTDRVARKQRSRCVQAKIALRASTNHDACKQRSRCVQAKIMMRVSTNHDVRLIIWDSELRPSRFLLETVMRQIVKPISDI